MSGDFEAGDTVYAGYPTAHVYDFERTKKGGLSFKKVKHLLWGDWIKVTTYDFAATDAAGTVSDAERRQIKSATKGMVPVRVRNCSGYMYPADLQPQRLLEIVFVDVGQGDGALLVTPNDKKYVIDAGVADNMYRYLRWRFAGFTKARIDFDGLIITHPDKDHYAGFEQLVEDDEVQATNIWHNGLVEQFGLTESGKQLDEKGELLGSIDEIDGQDSLTGLIETDAALKTFLSVEDRWINKKPRGKPKGYPELLSKAVEATNNDGKRRFPNIEMLSTAHGKKHKGRSYLPGFDPTNKTGCVIEIIGPVTEPDAGGSHRLRVFSKKPREKTTSMDTGKTKNGHSVLLKLDYWKDKQADTKVSILFGGDLNSAAEMFLLKHYTGLNVYEPEQWSPKDLIERGRAHFGVDVTKACHHGSADFTDVFLTCINPAATVISSGDEESHAHPRCDTLGAIGHNGRGHRSLIFSTELCRSTKEFTKRENSPWFKAARLEGKARAERNPDKKAELLAKAEELSEQEKKTNVTVYGSINLRSDGEKVVLAYMLERPSKSRRWDVYTLEPGAGKELRYVPVKEAEAAEKKRRKAAGQG